MIFPHIGLFVPLCTILWIFIRGTIGKPVTMIPSTRLALSWDMFDEVATIEPGRACTPTRSASRCRVERLRPTVTVSPDSLRDRIGASETTEC